jgi:hypothetical protein
MTALAAHQATDPDPERDDAPPKLRWWRELLIAGIFYGLYSVVRNTFGAGPESRDIAYRHAVDVIDIEKAVGLWFEPRLQHWYLGLPGHGLIRGWNIFYGTAHFAVTMGILVLAFRKAPQWYRFVRTMLAGATALALIGFAGFTLMPPRLLDSSSKFGSCKDLGAGCRGYQVTDTVERWGGIWKFGQGKMSVVSNQYAAMPSMHFGWSTWCAITLVLVIGRGRLRWLAFLYPAATLFCILVTGNHFWLDALFGGLALAGGAAIATLVQRLTASRADPDADAATVDATGHTATA